MNADTMRRMTALLVLAAVTFISLYLVGRKPGRVHERATGWQLPARFVCIRTVIR